MYNKINFYQMNSNFMISFCHNLPYTLFLMSMSPIPQHISQSFRIVTIFKICFSNVYNLFYRTSLSQLMMVFCNIYDLFLSLVGLIQSLDILSPYNFVFSRSNKKQRNFHILEHLHIVHILNMQFSFLVQIRIQETQKERNHKSRKNCVALSNFNHHLLKRNKWTIENSNTNVIFPCAIVQSSNCTH